MLTFLTPASTAAADSEMTWAGPCRALVKEQSGWKENEEKPKGRNNLNFMLIAELMQCFVLGFIEVRFSLMGLCHTYEFGDLCSKEKVWTSVWSPLAIVLFCFWLTIAFSTQAVSSQDQHYPFIWGLCLSIRFLGQVSTKVVITSVSCREHLFSFQHRKE